MILLLSSLQVPLTSLAPLLSSSNKKQEKTSKTKDEDEFTMSGLPNNISSAGVSASEIPDGFSLAGPNSGGGAGGGGGDPAAEQAKQRQMQREAILEQAMTPDALARLRRVKVSMRRQVKVPCDLFIISDITNNIISYHALTIYSL